MQLSTLLPYIHLSNFALLLNLSLVLSKISLERTLKVGLSLICGFAIHYDNLYHKSVILLP